MPNIELSTILPTHIQEFLQRSDAVGKGLSVIAGLQSEEDFIKADIALENTEKTAAILRGFLYMHYRKNSEPRNFPTFLAKRGISQSTAYDYMSEAAIYAELPSADMCANLAQIGSMKVRQLKALSKEELAEFAEGKEVRGLTIEQAKEQTTEQLKQSLREYERSINAELAEAIREKEEYKTKYKTVEAQLETQQRQTLERYDDIKLPVWAIAVREEASVHGDLCLKHIAGLDRCLTELHKYHAKALDGESEMADFRAAAGVAFYNIANVLVQASKALAHAKSFLGEAEVGNFDMSIPLTPVEAEQIASNIGHINTLLSIKESARVSDRIARQGRVGAPKKNPKAFDDEI